MKYVCMVLCLGAMAACGGPEKEPAGADTINNDSTKPGDTGYVKPADSANNAKYIQPNSDNPPKPVDH